MEDWVTVARILRARGNRGEVAAEPLSSSFERLSGLREVTLFSEGRWPEGRAAEVEEVWEHRAQVIFKFRGIDSIGDAEQLRGVEVRVPRSERPGLSEGEYYHSDLVGCTVVEQGSGAVVGAVEQVREYGAAPVLVVIAPDGVEVMIPLAKDICKAVDIAARKIEVALPDGLKDLNRR